MKPLGFWLVARAAGVAAVLLLAAGCQQGDAGRAWGPAVRGYRCALAAVPHARQDNVLPVTIALENDTSDTVELTGLPRFFLSVDGVIRYWCHARIINLAVQPQLSTFVLPGGAPRQFALDLAELPWETDVRSAWPTRPFADVVAPGEYLLTFELQLFTDGDPDIVVRSNEVAVTIPA